MNVLGSIKGIKLHGKFAKGITVLAGSAVVGQIAVLFCTPIITRLYSPRDFGILAVYTSVLTVIGVVSSLRYEMAIPISDDDGDAFNLLVISLLFLAGFTLVVAAGFIVSFIFPLNYIKEIKILKPYFWILPLGIFITGAYRCLSYWALRYQKYRVVARTKLTQSLGQICTQVGIGSWFGGPIGLLLGQIIGQGSGNFVLLKFVKNCGHTKNIHKSEMKKVLIQYRKFPLVSSFSALINNAGLQIAPLLFQAVYGTQVVGWFALGQKIIAMPTTLIGNAISQVYFSEAATLARSDPQALQKLFIKTMLRLLTFGGLPIIVTSLISPILFSSILGHRWYEAGEFVRILSLMFGIQFAIYPLSETLTVIQRQGLQLFWDVLRLIIVSSAVIIAGLERWSSYKAIAVYGIGMTVSYVVLILLILRALKNETLQEELVVNGV